ncbi:MATE family efflux transporter [Brevibacillus fulvus]|uniref:Probable multidrug resistance protein NorM n=1 Tax=Brevibacillus fulvus TaxID=1125967 RepID=A0A939BRP0_9BACL|nr:MATE family efflux transporter [Brevibacillus fulvus]MBM7589653.1 putative MATE family efflux protein [Brevibacillus fulvus]
MTTSVKRDFTQGDLQKHLIAFSTPAIISGLAFQINGVWDAFIVGMFLSASDIAAMTISLNVSFFLFTLLLGFGVASSILIAQSFGKKDKKQTFQLIANSSLLMLTISMIAAILGELFLTRILQLMNTPLEVFQPTYRFLAVYLAGFPAITMLFQFSQIQRALGDATTPFRATIFSIIANMLFSPCFLLGIGPFPELGIGGVALSTVLANICGLIFSCLSSLRAHPEVFAGVRQAHFAPKLMINISKLGLPLGLNQMVLSISVVATTTIVNSYGPIVINGMGVGSRFDSLITQFIMGISSGISTMVAQNIGANQLLRVKETLRIGLRLLLFVMIILAAFFYVTAPYLLRLFSQDPAVLQQAVTYLRYIAVGYIAFGIANVFEGILRAFQKVHLLLFTTLFTAWLCRIPLMVWGGSTFGIVGLWLGICLSFLLSALTLGVITLQLFRRLPQETTKSRLSDDVRA